MQSGEVPAETLGGCRARCAVRHPRHSESGGVPAEHIGNGHDRRFGQPARAMLRLEDGTNLAGVSRPQSAATLANAGRPSASTTQ